MGLHDAKKKEPEKFDYIDVGVAMSENKQELLPCPFCGGESELISEGIHTHYVRCMECSQQFMHMSSEDAKAAWNRRAVPSASAGAVPEGYALLPIEPTDAMIHVWLTNDELHRMRKGNCAATSRVIRLYKKMIDAAMNVGKE